MLEINVRINVQYLWLLETSNFPNSSGCSWEVFTHDKKIMFIPLADRFGLIEDHRLLLRMFDTERIADLRRFQYTRVKHSSA